ncbi:hypothetical protein DH2020_025901 [Rehmannia glutinosa]|uniref:Reverse transcriptase n=1 Tax=Rehmannia glutinosa TaxID=99300 RepID=A0ABR0VYF0_REHGL
MQRAKQHWYKEGDRNSNFFHAFATARRETNTISSLKDANGVLQTDKDRIESIIGSHYADIFSSSMPSQDNIDKVLSRVRTKVTDEMAAALSQPFTADEIKRALKHMHPFKSPDPDGMSPVFFQKFWHIVGNDVSRFALHFLNHNALLQLYNYTHIVLIPKVRRPDQVSQFRPISLCNVIYKIASKALAVRLRNILPTLISRVSIGLSSWAAYHDNILCCLRNTSLNEYS